MADFKGRISGLLLITMILTNNVATHTIATPVNRNADVVKMMELNADISIMQASSEDEMDEEMKAYLDSVRDVNWEHVRRDILHEIKEHPHYDKGSVSPLLLRLTWHSAGTWDPDGKPLGGANGASMRFEPEKGYEDNKGLELARELLERVKAKHTAVSFSDLWVLAGYVAVEDLKGPHIEFQPGRIDVNTGGPETCPPEDRLPFFHDNVAEMRKKFHRMGLTDRDMVALMGGHSIGHTHPEHSGFPYHNWDLTPLIFDNSYYDFVLRDWWTLDDEDPDHPYYRNRSWMMLLSDIALTEDANLKKIIEEYKDDEDKFHEDFAVALKKLTEAGMPTS